jgi:hypothetical protein
MILPYLTSPPEPAAVPPPPLRKGVVVRQNGAALAGPLPDWRYGRYGSLTAARQLSRKTPIKEHADADDAARGIRRS